MALIANVNRNSKTRPEAYKPEDFLPKWVGDDEKPMADAASQLRRAWGLSEPARA